uniref:RRM domain-containing protein n=1 Tax=Chenopodium quinoa TaxID=63459 RepID=A0A803MEL7_CHEQI
MTMSDFNSNNGDNNTNKSQFGDTTLTKVFVGGLAWETPKQALYEHFEKFGEILEAVIISDKITGRSKGYGFVTFKEPEAAKKACEDATPTINGRRANCNLAALGARRPPRSSSTTPQPHQRYSPTYIAADVGYNHKLSYSGGAYINGGHYHPQMYPAHIYQSTSSGPITAQPPIISKPTTPVCVTSPSGDGFIVVVVCDRLNRQRLVGPSHLRLDLVYTKRILMEIIDFSSFIP